MKATIDCHFIVHSFFMKCSCVVTGHSVRIDLSLYLSLGLIGLVMVVLVVVVGMVVVTAVDAAFVLVVLSLVPVHLERCSFQRTHSQIVPHSKH